MKTNIETLTTARQIAKEGRTFVEDANATIVMKKIIIAVSSTSEGEDLRVFDSYDEVYGLYDYIEEKFVSPTTYKNLKEGYTPCRYGNTIRAYNL